MSTETARPAVGAAPASRHEHLTLADRIWLLARDAAHALNWAGVQRLPVVFVLENNQQAYSTRLDRFQTGLRDSSSFLEAEIGRLSGLPAGTIGVQLAEQAFAASKGKLADPTVQPGQATSLQRLFMGYFGWVGENQGEA